MALSLRSSSLSDINCVKGEIHNVLTIMRLNSRWASPLRFEKEMPLHSESPLMRSLKALHEKLTMHGYHSLGEVDTVHFLQPFLDIVMSPLTTGPITGAALSSLHKFLLYGFIRMDSVRAAEGINLIAQAISKCVFEETDNFGDEVVLMKVLELSALCVRCEVGTLLHCEEIVLVFNKCLHVSKEDTRRSSLLRSTADNTMAYIVLVVFSRARSRAPINQEEGDDDNAWEELDEKNASSQAGHDQEAIVSIMRSLSAMCNPRESSEHVCVLSLSLINIALEAGGDSLGLYPALVFVMQGDLCKHLLQNSQSTDLTILSLTLRVVFNLFNSIKDHLKVQLEVFLTSVHLRLLDSDSGVSNERRELALESLLEFCHEPALMLDLYINYDCDVQCTNLFETVCGVLATHALPQPTKQINSINRLALDGLLSIIATISAQCSISTDTGSGGGEDMAYESEEEMEEEWGTRPARLSSPTTSNATSLTSLSSDSHHRGVSDDGMSFDGSDVPPVGLTPSKRSKSGQQMDSFIATAREKTAEVLQQRKKMKRRLSLVTERFNTDESLKKFIPYAIELELLPPNPDAQAIAQLLKTTPGLDKTQIGMYIGKGPPDKYPLNAAVLKAYVRLFDFSALTFDESFRLFLEEFRLPGEAQCIDRIMETFAAEVYRQCPHLPFKSQDAAFILAFSLIMLNTDLHNPRIDDARRMTFEQFVSSNRDTNAGEPMPVGFMKQLYNSIKDSEIELRGSTIGGEMQALETGKLQWARLVAARSETIALASFTPSNLSSHGVLYPAGVHERDMFSCIAAGSFKALVKVLQTSTDDFLVLKALQGVYRFATISNYYKMGERLNSSLVALLEITSKWLQGQEGSQSVNIPRACFLRDLARRKEVAYPWQAGEGAAQHMGTVCLHTALEVMADYGSLMTRASWDAFVEMLTVLLDREALPTALVHLDDMTDLRGNQLKPSSHSRPPQFKSSQRKWIENDSQAADQEQAGLLSSFTSIFWAPTVDVSKHSMDKLSSQTAKMTKEDGDSGGDVTRSSTLAMASMLKMVLDVEALFSPVRPANEARWARSLPDESLVDLVKSLTDCRKDQVLQSLLSLQRKPSDANLASSSKTLHQASGSGGGFWSRSAVATMNAEVLEAERLSEGRTVFKLELTARIVTANTDRLELILPSFFKLFSSLVMSTKVATHMPFLLERAMIVMLRLWPHISSSSAQSTTLELPMQANFDGVLELMASIPSEFTRAVSDRIAYGVSSLFANTSKRATKEGCWPYHDKQWEVALKLLTKCLDSPDGRPAVVDAMTVCLHMERAPTVPLLIQSNNFRSILEILLNLSSVEAWVNKYGSCSAGPKSGSGASEGSLPPTREMLDVCATSLGLLAQLVDRLRMNRESFHRLNSTSSSCMDKRDRNRVETGHTLAQENLLPPPDKVSETNVMIREEVESVEGLHNARDRWLLEVGTAVTDEELFSCWKKALVQLCKATELAHFTTVKASCDAMQRMLSSAHQLLLLGGEEDGFADLEAAWGWVFAEVLFKQGPLLRVLQTSSLRPMDQHCESRAIQCIGVLSQVLLHHMTSLLTTPALFEDTVLKLSRLDAIIYKYTRSEAAAESLMNLLTVVQCEIGARVEFKTLMSRAREIVDSLCPALTDELHARAPGLHPSSLHRLMEERMAVTSLSPPSANKTTPSHISPAMERLPRQLDKDVGSASFTV